MQQHLHFSQGGLMPDAERPLRMHGCSNDQMVSNRPCTARAVHPTAHLGCTCHSNRSSIGSRGRPGLTAKTGGVWGTGQAAGRAPRARRVQITHQLTNTVGR